MRMHFMLVCTFEIMVIKMSSVILKKDTKG